MVSSEAWLVLSHLEAHQLHLVILIRHSIVFGGLAKLFVNHATQNHHYCYYLTKFLLATAEPTAIRGIT